MLGELREEVSEVRALLRPQTPQICGLTRRPRRPLCCSDCPLRVRSSLTELRCPYFPLAMCVGSEPYARIDTLGVTVKINPNGRLAQAPLLKLPKSATLKARRPTMDDYALEVEVEGRDSPATLEVDADLEGGHCRRCEAGGTDDIHIFDKDEPIGKEIEKKKVLSLVAYPLQEVRSMSATSTTPSTRSSRPA